MTESRSGDGLAVHSRSQAVVTRLKRRRWAWAMTGLMVVSGMVYSFWWATLVRHAKFVYWVIPTDLWSTVRDGHYVVWGALPYIYGSRTALVTLPGLPLVLAPVVALGDHLHLTESFGPWLVARPTSWPLYGPVLLALGGAVIFAGDAWAEELDLGRWRRVLCDLGLMAVGWDMVARWGHPEDALALAAALYCLLSIKQTQFRRAGWCLGIALCFQPLVVLLVPVVLAVAGRRQIGPLLLRAAFLPAGLLAVVLAIDARDVIRSVVDEPNFPTVDQATPLASLAPNLGDHTIGAGPSRVVAVVVAGALGVLAWRWRRDWTRLLWLGACMLATRGVFESVMVPYYVTPALLVAVLVACAVLPWWRILLVGAAAGLTVHQFNTHSGSVWTWWIESAGVLILTMALAVPSPGMGVVPAEVRAAKAGEDPVAASSASVHDQAELQPVTAAR